MIQKQVKAHGTDSRTEMITVSNGEEFFQIPETDLEAAEQDGFYRPLDRGLTIIADDRYLFEVPIKVGQNATASGFHNLLAQESTGTHVTPTSDVQGRGPANLERVESRPHGDAEDQTQHSELDSLAVMDGLSQAEQLAEEQRLENEEQLQAVDGWRRHLLKFKFWLATHRTRLSRQLGGSGISLLVHVAVLLILASLFLANDPPKDVMLVSSTSTDEYIEEVTFETEQIEIVEPSDDSESEPAEVEEVSLDVAESVETPDFMAAVSGDAVEPPKNPASGDSNDAMPRRVKKPTIFGSKFNAINYVFVIDNSNSMTKGRFETALRQLMITVSQLTPKQRFYVIFYSDTAYPMLHPQPVLELVPATKQNKNALGRWLNTIELCLKTNGMKAIQAAFDLEPDVIYVLGDGAFTDGAAKYFVRNPHDKIVVHTRGMEVSKKNAEAFRMLAETHRGTYKDVGVSPQGLQMSKQYPRRRNNKRGPVWGVTLPVNKK